MASPQPRAAPHARQHIQDFNAAEKLEPHWGYADRVVPCTSDPGSCAYLDLVYDAHDVGMLYTGVMWAVVAAVLLLWVLARRVFPSRAPPFAADEGHRGESQSSSSPMTRGGPARLRAAAAAASRRLLLPESARWVFGHTTRLQVAVLAAAVAYLTVFTFAGMHYRVWVTPVKGMDGVHNTRSTLGPWSDRVGVLAYALTPLSVLLASRESLLSLLTGVPYQSFVFLHRWLGYVVLVQSALHTVGWCVVEIRLYQPQPAVAAKWIVQGYMVYGIVAMLLLTVLFLLSTKWAIRAFGYEFFRKAHYVLAMIYIGACVGHWKQLHCFLTPAVVLWAVDRLARLGRTALLHYHYLPDGSMGFVSARASARLFADPDGGREDVVRLDFDHPQQPWHVGQHFFLCFPELSIWQSHPMTPLSLPGAGSEKGTAGSRHSYVMRAKTGETRKLADLVAKRQAASSLTGGGAAKEAGGQSEVDPSVSVILTGPYGQPTTDDLAPETNVLCVAGGTGVTFVLPPLLELVRARPVPGRKIELVWAVRHEQDTEWVQPELDELRAASATHGLSIDVYVTRESKTRSRSPAVAGGDGKEAGVTAGAPAVSSSAASSASSGGEQVVEKDNVHVHRPADVAVPAVGRPHMRAVVDAFVGAVARGSTTVFASGPLGMVGDLREAVAAANSGSRVWGGEERFDVRLVSDDRVEW